MITACTGLYYQPAFTHGQHRRREASGREHRRGDFDRSPSSAGTPLDISPTTTSSRVDGVQTHLSPRTLPSVLTVLVALVVFDSDRKSTFVSAPTPMSFRTTTSTSECACDCFAWPALVFQERQITCWTRILIRQNDLAMYKLAL